MIVKLCFIGKLIFASTYFLLYYLNNLSTTSVLLSSFDKTIEKDYERIMELDFF